MTCKSGAKQLADQHHPRTMSASLTVTTAHRGAIPCRMLNSRGVSALVYGLHWIAVGEVRRAIPMRTIHFVMYLPDQKSAMYRRTADVSHAVLTVANVPPNVSDRAVELSVNLTKIAFPFRTSRVVDYTRLGKGRFVNLY